ncbi:hypothetical protein TCA2_4619 [Paenibacillus sp. TCA20]|uniref:Uncharacterized protein n=1 Tax=Paenibacillus urinalis TaxID=521520 RepID=A0ABY7XGT5_9BACL|nr:MULTISPECIES: hypothetical protein [Paenibacillus]WDI05047.1 hypothetical protein PUW25_26115 [Paenibacillus urinalis]GAK42127.1 hypothetical protein TCA2_4619 [Paenibacillus sp. TCA20]
MNLMEVYLDQTVESFMLWIVNKRKQTVSLTVSRLEEFRPHPDYSDVTQGKVIIEEWVMEELKDDPSMDGWEDRMRVLMMKFIGGGERAYQIVYHRLGRQMDGSWLLTFNCKEYE